MTIIKLPNLTEKQASELSLYLGLAAGYESEKGNQELSNEILKFAQFIISNTELIEIGDVQTTEVTRSSDSRIAANPTKEVVWERSLENSCRGCGTPVGAEHAKNCITYLTTPLRDDIPLTEAAVEDLDERIPITVRIGDEAAFLPGGELFLSDGSIEEAYIDVVNCVTNNVSWNSLKAITKRVTEKGGMGAMQLHEMQSRENEENIKDYLDHAVLIGHLLQPKSGYWVKPEDAIEKPKEPDKLLDKDKVTKDFKEFSM